MLRKIFNAVKAIGAFFSAVIGFIEDLIASLLQFFSLIPKAVSYVVDVIGFVPATMLSFITVILSVLVIKKIINR